jgi:hypothetical protein
MTQLRSRMHSYKVLLAESESLYEIIRNILTDVKLSTANKGFVSHLQLLMSCRTVGTLTALRKIAAYTVAIISIFFVKVNKEYNT